MLRRLTALALCLCLLCSLVPAVSAASTMTTSDRGIDFIKGYEGFIKYAVWDHTQWSIGYGTRCEKDEYPDGITEAQATALLKEYVKEFEASLDYFLIRNDLTLTQNQYDALISYTYNLGPSWMSSHTELIDWLRDPTSDLDLLNAMVVHSHAGGKVLSGLVSRRIREAQIFLYDDYTGKDCPQYAAVTYDSNGGITLEQDVVCYPLNAPYQNYPTPVRAGYRFTGWYTAASGGEEFYSYDIANRDRVMYAHWEEIGGNNGGGSSDVPPITYLDVKESDWFYDYVSRATTLGLFKGTSDSTFQPNAKMTRAMCAVVLYRIAGEPATNAQAPFTDLGNAYYTTAVNWCYENGIVQGKNTTTFDPNGVVSRQDFITMVYRFAAMINLGLSNTDSLTGFHDYTSVSKYAVQPFGWAVAGEIICGVQKDGAMHLCPFNSLSRAEAAKILVIFVEQFLM